MPKLSIVVAVSLVAAAIATGPAAGQGPSEPTAVVTLGDSYISGESGRWKGNWGSSLGSRGGTDRAAYRWWRFWLYDAERVYGSTDNSGCHRSDVAPVLTPALAADARINLACSGARTVHIWRARRGGRSLKGEPPQADQLRAVAASHDVEMIVLSVGGNDLGFSDIIIDCTVEYLTSPTWRQNRCNGEQQAKVDGRMARAMAGVDKAIREIRRVMRASGERARDYSLVLVSYPSPVPRGSEFRYGESGLTRAGSGGCPFWNADATWARDSLVPQIADNLAAVAEARRVELLDLRDALDGREVCSVHTTHGTGGDAEWARFVTTGILQGEAQESLHPNRFGQQAIGTCLALLAARPRGDYACTNVAGAGPESMRLSGIDD